MTTQKSTKKPEHYVDNKKFYEALVAYNNERKEAQEAGDEPPRIPEYVGACFLKIAQRLTTSPNFRNYSYREDMVSDGVENCVNYIDNFDPERFNNPFAYFTQIIYFACVRRIKKERRQTYIKFKALIHSTVFNELSHSDGPMNDDEQAAFMVNIDSEHMTTFIRDYEEAEAKQKARRAKPASKKGIEPFIEGEDA